MKPIKKDCPNLNRFVRQFGLLDTETAGVYEYEAVSDGPRIDLSDVRDDVFAIMKQIIVQTHSHLITKTKDR